MLVAPDIASAIAFVLIPNCIDLQSMLVRSGQEQSLLSFQGMPPLYDVRKDHGV
jgi:hypothetical protein